MFVPTVHQIKLQDAHSVPWRIEAKCGASAKSAGADGSQPAGFSAWTSDVNCRSCLATIAGL
jgi:hypothetical protein